MINAPDQWDPALELGNPMIDRQHRSLFGMIADLDAKISKEEFGQAVLDALHAMKAYAATHFADEEKLMAETGWPGLEAHRMMHGEFMRRTSLFSGEQLLDSEWTALDMMRYLLKWLAEHIRVQDRSFFEWKAGK